MKKLINDVMRIFAGMTILIIIIGKNTKMPKANDEYFQETVDKLDNIFVSYLGKY